MSQLSVYFFGNRTFLQHDRDGIVGLRQRRDENIDVVSVTGPGRGNINLIAVHGRTIAQRVGDESKNGGVGRNEVREPRAKQCPAAHVEEGFGCNIDLDNHALHVDNQQRLGERVQNLLSLALEDSAGNPPGHSFAGVSLTQHFGAVATGMGVYELEPGNAAWPYHFEAVEEEWLIVIEGELTLRTPAGEAVLRAGEVACFPAGGAGAHAVRNHTDAPVRYAMPSTNAPYGDAWLEMTVSDVILPSRTEK